MNPLIPEIPVFVVPVENPGLFAIFFNEKTKTGKTESTPYTYINTKTHIHLNTDYPLFKYFSTSLSYLDSVFPFLISANHSADLHRNFLDSGRIPFPVL